MEIFNKMLCGRPPELINLKNHFNVRNLISLNHNDLYTNDAEYNKLIIKNMYPNVCFDDCQYNHSGYSDKKFIISFHINENNMYDIIYVKQYKFNIKDKDLDIVSGDIIFDFNSHRMFVCDGDYIKELKDAETNTEDHQILIKKAFYYIEKDTNVQKKALNQYVFITMGD